MKVLLNDEEFSIKKGCVKKIKGRDPRYSRNYEIPILFYDEEKLLIINKPWNVCIDGSTLKCPTIESYLKEYFPQFPKHYLIHQLDYVTSGIHCWGLSKQSTGMTAKCFMNRTVKKTYTAIVRGHLKEDEMEINAPIAKSLIEPKLMCIGTEENIGKPSKTFVKVLKRGYFKEIPVTVVELEPYTGRRHQLRVHLLSIGHPIIGDFNYEDPLTEKAFRCMLHAWKIYLPIQKDFTIEIETDNPFIDLVSETIEKKWWKSLLKFRFICQLFKFKTSKKPTGFYHKNTRTTRPSELLNPVS